VPSFDFRCGKGFFAKWNRRKPKLVRKHRHPAKTPPAEGPLRTNRGRPAFPGLRHILPGRCRGVPGFARPSDKDMGNRSRLEFSNRFPVLGEDPLDRPAKKFVRRKGCRGLDFHRLTFRASKELFEKGHRFEPLPRKTIFQS
jgi:hypothetical protein